MDELEQKYLDATGDYIPWSQLIGLSDKEIKQLVNKAISEKKPIAFDDDLIY